jgi:hypothetical protein
MSGIFSSPKIPAPPPPPAPLPVPTLDNARQAQQAQDRLAGRRGRAASILTGVGGDLSTPPTSGAKQLLGS